MSKKISPKFLIIMIMMMIRRIFVQDVHFSCCANVSPVPCILNHRAGNNNNNNNNDNNQVNHVKKAKSKEA